MDPIEKFKQDVSGNIEALGEDKSQQEIAKQWMIDVSRHQYTYNFNWLGRPIIQFPQDMVAIQNLIWTLKPDLIIETGIAHGGSLILSASMLAMLDVCEAIEQGVAINPRESARKVIGIDIDIRAHNRAAIEAHPMSSYIKMVEGSSIAPETIAQVHKEAENYSTVMVMLDSNHTHEHVLAELEAYAPLTSVGSYCCVFDTLVEDLPESLFSDRPWGPGDNPKTAVWEYLKQHPEFEIDETIVNQLSISVAPDGYLKRVS